MACAAHGADQSILLFSGMRVGACRGVRERRAVLGELNSGQVLDVDLVADPGAGRDDPPSAEGTLATSS
jgi:hypothetical protein